jgi:hypothetical protein
MSMTERRAQIVHDQTLLRPEVFTTIYPFITPLTLGLLKVYRLDLEPERMYLADVGFNDVFVYDRESARDRRKLFWKLNLASAPPMDAMSMPRRLAVAVDIKEIPNFDPQFGQQGGWVKIDYHLLIQLEVTRDRAGQVRHATNPLSTVRNAALRAARQILPFTPYQEALIATVEQRLQQSISGDPNVLLTGLKVVLVDVEGVEGSHKLDDKLQESFDRMLQAKDRREIAVQFASMDRDVFQRMLEVDAPASAALEFRARAANQMVEALLVSGLNPVQAYSATAQVARDIGTTDSLAYQVAANTFKQIKVEDWPTLQVPQGKSHEERLKWERQVAQQRVPMQLQDSDNRLDIFTFVLETNDRLEVIWSAPEFPPQIYVNGEDRRSNYIVLSPGIYEYSKTTIWDLYLETRRILVV